MTGSADLTAALRAHAQGLHCLEAAVELLISHAAWLRRGDFLHHFVHTTPGPSNRTPIAAINWPEAIAALDRGKLPCSGAEGRMLRLAASLAAGIPVDLRDALTSLDSHNTELVSYTVKHATGHR
jgi:hypothetical protein